MIITSIAWETGELVVCFPAAMIISLIDAFTANMMVSVNTYAYIGYPFVKRLL